MSRCDISWDNLKESKDIYITWILFFYDYNSGLLDILFAPKFFLEEVLLAASNIQDPHYM